MTMIRWKVAEPESRMMPTFVDAVDMNESLVGYIEIHMGQIKRRPMSGVMCIFQDPDKFGENYETV